jgi:hypothetical protein
MMTPAELAEKFIQNTAGVIEQIDDLLNYLSTMDADTVEEFWHMYLPYPWEDMKPEREYKICNEAAYILRSKVLDFRLDFVAMTERYFARKFII